METLVPIVADLADKYTSKESTSITYEKARQFMGAVLYCINEYMVDECDSPNDNTVESQLSAQEAYQNGYELVIRKVGIVRELYNKISSDFKSYGNENYYDTFIKGISGFIKYYDPKFNPQDTIITMDYPVIVSVHHQCGVDAIYSYIQSIGLEQTFLNKIPEDYICNALINYHEDYEELFDNICSIVLRRILGEMLFKGMKSVEEKVMYISSHTKDELMNTILYLLRTLIEREYGNQSALFDYLSSDIPDYCSQLKNAVIHGYLGKLL